MAKSRVPKLSSGLSVVIPCYNAESSISAAITSAFHAGADEVIVVDDGSTDDSAKIARSLGAQTLFQRNLGPADARMLGFRNCTRSHVIFLDADDELIPAGMNRLFKILESADNLVGLAGSTIVRRENRTLGRLRAKSQVLTSTYLLDRGMPPGPPSCSVWKTSEVWKRTHGKKVQPYTRHAEDYAFYLSMSLSGTINFLPLDVTIYSSGQGRSSKNIVLGLQDADVIREYYSELSGAKLTRRSNSQTRGLIYFRKYYEQSWTNPFLKILFLFLYLLADPIGAAKRIVVTLLKFLRL